MTPTLLDGDRVIIERLYPLLGQSIERFDLVAVVPPYIDGKPVRANNDWKHIAGNLSGLPGFPQDPLYVRRVIGLPGEKVLVKANEGIYINDRRLEEASLTTEKPARDLFNLGDIKMILTSGEIVAPFPESSEPIVVPAGSFFVLPDHRNRFEGSDMWGFIRQSQIVGRVSHSYGEYYLHPFKRPQAVWANEKVALNDKGVKALESRDYTNAIALFNQALSVDSDFKLARDNLSIAYNNYAIELKANPEAAADKLHKALYIDEDNEMTRANLDKILEIMGKNPQDFQVRLELGDRAYMENRYLDALVEYREANRIKNDPAVRDKIRDLEQGQEKLFPREFSAPDHKVEPEVRTSQ